MVDHSIATAVLPALPVGQIDIGLFFLQVLMLIVSVFLILLILVQRGKGGGLTGALGGMGGQSAFGSKAGDAFTKITVVTALVWITLCMITIAKYNPPPRAQAKTPVSNSISGGSQDATDANVANESNASSVDLDTSSDDAAADSSEPAATDAESGTIELDLSSDEEAK